MKLVLIAIIALLALFIGYVMSKPNSFRIQRSIAIKAPPEKIFGYINDLQQNLLWSPWEKDPAMKRELSGPVSGVGATYAWEGNMEVGKGTLQIIRSTPLKIDMQLTMVKPMAANNLVEFTLEPKEDETIVTWSMSGPQPFLGKLMNTFINCDKMVGDTFVKGLINLKALVEKQ